MAGANRSSSTFANWSRCQSTRLGRPGTVPAAPAEGERLCKGRAARHWRRPGQWIDHSLILRYIELKSGHSDDGPAWIGYVTPSKTGRTAYFNGRGLMKLKGQRRGASGGNYVDMETGESFWVSGVKKNGQDRHWAGSGKVLVEAAAVADYLNRAN